MRILKLALATGFALLIASGSAYAITVKKRTEAPGLPPEIWAIAGAFCADQELASRGRRVRGKQRGRRCLPHPDAQGRRQDQGEADRHRGRLSYSYEIVESPLPIKNYKSKLWLETDDEPDRTVIYWQSDFDANGASDDEAKKIITGILSDGVSRASRKTRSPPGMPSIPTKPRTTTRIRTAIRTRF